MRAARQQRNSLILWGGPLNTAAVLREFSEVTATRRP
jgi:hypothetical protein